MLFLVLHLFTIIASQNRLPLTSVPGDLLTELLLLTANFSPLLFYQLIIVFMTLKPILQYLNSIIVDGLFVGRQSLVQSFLLSSYGFTFFVEENFVFSFKVTFWFYFFELVL